ncbi:hypothetical protein F7P10_04385 [Actinomadura sp. WMMB 499]|nr:hypothetical protein F7P10_04385 [Actinomadura sp. WMMB 499]
MGGGRTAPGTRTAAARAAPGTRTAAGRAAPGTAGVTARPKAGTAPGPAAGPRTDSLPPRPADGFADLGCPDDRAWNALRRTSPAPMREPRNSRPVCTGRGYRS